MKFAGKMKKATVKPGSVLLYWIGQAGFLIKTADDKLILVDPYLSDAVYNETKEKNGYAFKRMAPALFEADEIEADWIFCSHEHGDHVDPDAIATLAAGAKTTLYTNAPGAGAAKEAGVPADKIHILSSGMNMDFGSFKLTVTAAQHGKFTPGAMGFIFDFGFTKIYYAGDTAYDLETLAPALAAKPEVALLPINGAFGNLNSKEAAMLANDLQAKICVPHHFWTFPRHMGAPQELIDLMPECAPRCELRMLTPGEPLFIESE